MIERSSHNAVEKFRKKDKKRLYIPLEGDLRFYLQHKLFAFCSLFFNRYLLKKIVLEFIVLRAELWR